MEDESRNEAETVSETALQVVPKAPPPRLWRSRRGSEYIQNLAIIGLFVIAIFGAITALKSAVEKKFNDQAKAVEANIPGG